MHHSEKKLDSRYANETSQCPAADKKVLLLFYYSLSKEKTLLSLYLHKELLKHILALITYSIHPSIWWVLVLGNISKWFSLSKISRNLCDDIIGTLDPNFRVLHQTNKQTNKQTKIVVIVIDLQFNSWKSLKPISKQTTSLNKIVLWKI